MSDTRELYTFDETYGGCVAGVDEAGRGPLAGPVTVACCIPGKNIIDGVNDSKKLSEKKRKCHRRDKYTCRDQARNGKMRKSARYFA